MKVIFNTAPFEYSHQRPPRGRGSWAFCDQYYTNKPEWLDHTVFSPGGMTYSEAKKWARTNPKLVGIQYLDVLP